MTAGPIILLALALFVLAIVLLAALSGPLARSLGWSWPSPRELWWVLFNRNTKRNLALAHATINHLEGTHGPTHMAARPGPSGFHLARVPFPADVVLTAAREARHRLLAGESYLRVRPRESASTLIAVAAAWLAVVVLMAGAGARPRDAVVGLILVLLLSGPLGRLAQRTLTTRTDVRRLCVGACTQEPASAGQVMGALFRGDPTTGYYIHTQPVAGADEAAASGGRVHVTVTRVEPESR
jgi:hypothetical protein